MSLVEERYLFRGEFPSIISNRKLYLDVKSVLLESVDFTADSESHSSGTGSFRQKRDAVRECQERINETANCREQPTVRSSTLADLHTSFETSKASTGKQQNRTRSEKVPAVSATRKLGFPEQKKHSKITSKA